MAKRGRKPKEEKKGYFYEREEQAVIAYNQSDSAKEKNEIYETILKPAFTKMIESIIRRYKLYGPDEEFTDTFNDTLSAMLTKIGNFKPEALVYCKIEKPSDEVKGQAVNVAISDLKEPTEDSPKYVATPMIDNEEEKEYYEKVLQHYKAYSYCGTVAKNYLLGKRTNHRKQLLRNTPYEEVAESITNDIRYSDSDENGAIANEIIPNIHNKLQEMVNNAEKEGLNENEIKVGNALCFLLEHWEEILGNTGSNKLNKSSVLYFLREDTLLTTKEIRDGMKRYKAVYKLLKQSLFA